MRCKKIFKFELMRLISVNIPDSVDIDDKEVTMMVASSLYEKGRLSLGQAAEMAGLSKRTFSELIGNFGISVFNFPSTELGSDVNNA
jgi:predicted HTH domain antitoxin